MVFEFILPRMIPIEDFEEFEAETEAIEASIDQTANTIVIS